MFNILFKKKYYFYYNFYFLNFFFLDFICVYKFPKKKLNFRQFLNLSNVYFKFYNVLNLKKSNADSLNFSLAYITNLNPIMFDVKKYYIGRSKKIGFYKGFCKTSFFNLYNCSYFYSFYLLKLFPYISKNRLYSYFYIKNKNIVIQRIKTLRMLTDIRFYKPFFGLKLPFSLIFKNYNFIFKQPEKLLSLLKIFD